MLIQVLYCKLQYSIEHTLKEMNLRTLICGISYDKLLVEPNNINI